MDNPSVIIAEYFTSKQYSLADEALLFIAADVKKSKISEFCAALEEAGYSESFKNRISENDFLTYSNGIFSVHITYTSADLSLRISVSGKQAPTLGEAGEWRTTPLVTQLKLSYFSVDCGMSYLIRFADGTFAVIDGGHNEYEEHDRLFETISAQTPEGQKPVVSAWFITHAHSDHFECFVSFCEKYGDAVDVRRIIYNFAPSDMVALSPTARLDGLISSERYRDRVITAKTGQKFSFAGAVFEILFTFEDLLPDEIKNSNNTSLVIRADVADKRLIFTGDIMKQGSDRVCDIYPAEELKCDLLQVAHHGYSGGSTDFYRAADPKILFWPCPEFWFPVVKNWSPNEVLLESPRVEKIYFGGRKTVVLDPAKDFEDISLKETRDGSYVFCAGETKRVIDLGFSSVTGGRTGYGAPIAALSDAGLILKADDSFAVIDILSPYILKSEGYSASFTGKTGGICEKIGFFANYESPTVMSEESALFCGLAPNSEFFIEIKKDIPEGAVTLTSGGNKQTLKFSESSESGLYLILKNAEIVFSEINILYGGNK